MSDEVELVECSSCSIGYDPEELITFRNGQVVCSECRFSCERCDEYDYSDNSRYIEGHGSWCEDCANNNSYWCESCECQYDDGYGSYRIADIGVLWCEGCSQDNANWCENCDEYNRDECENCEGG